MLSSELVRRLRRRGVVLTPQRLAVVEFLKRSTTHPTVDEIYKKLRKKYPMMSQATVYSTLELLKKIGEIQELSIRKDKACFDPRPDPHHHFLCRKCSKILDIEVNCPIFKAGTIEGHKVEEVQAYLYGICASCLKEDAK
ncbi:MAG TPA: transcriptional repressor [bacterium (Candidatus Stahlbacteria)]|nr:transcriptional repressor [Candidatus Stahlbacteria bacterium]